MLLGDNWHDRLPIGGLASGHCHYSIQPHPLAVSKKNASMFLSPSSTPKPSELPYLLRDMGVTQCSESKMRQHLQAGLVVQLQRVSLGRTC